MSNPIQPLKETPLNYHVGIDVGGTTSTIAIGSCKNPTGDCDGENRSKLQFVSQQFETRASLPPKHTVTAIVSAVVQALGDLKIKPDQVAAVGLATPGPATLDGILLSSPNLNPEYWNRFPIRCELEKAFHAQDCPVPVFYIGDGQAAALGEFSVRTGRVDLNDVLKAEETSQNVDSLFMAIVGTGLGGGEVRQRRVVRGSQGRGGHLGHILLPEYAFRYPHDRELVVGHATCTVESAVSLTALAHQLSYRLALDRWRDHPLNEDDGEDDDGQSGSSVNTIAASMSAKAKQLRGLADQGDSLALELFDDQAKSLGLAMLSVNYIGDYDLLVIGGGVCDLSPKVRRRYLSIVEETYRQYALVGFRDLASVVFSVCGDEAPVIGAIQHAIERKTHENS